MWKEVKLRGSLHERCSKGGCCLPRLNPLEGPPGVFVNPGELQPEGWVDSPQSKLELKGACPQTERGRKGGSFTPCPQLMERRDGSTENGGLMPLSWVLPQSVQEKPLCDVINLWCECVRCFPFLSLRRRWCRS